MVEHHSLVNFTQAALNRYEFVQQIKYYNLHHSISTQQVKKFMPAYVLAARWFCARKL